MSNVFGVGLFIFGACHHFQRLGVIEIARAIVADIADAGSVEDMSRAGLADQIFDLMAHHAPLMDAASLEFRVGRVDDLVQLGARFRVTILTEDVIDATFELRDRAFQGAEFVWQRIRDLMKVIRCAQKQNRMNLKQLALGLRSIWRDRQRAGTHVTNLAVLAESPSRAAEPAAMLPEMVV